MVRDPGGRCAIATPACIAALAAAAPAVAAAAHRVAPIAAAAAQRAAGVASAVTHRVYALVDEVDEVVYYGITRREIAVRAAEHARDKSFARAQLVAEVPSRFAARALEQVLIEQRGVNNLLNRINSISQESNLYDDAIDLGRRLLQEIAQ